MFPRCIRPVGDGAKRPTGIIDSGASDCDIGAGYEDLDRNSAIDCKDNKSLKNEQTLSGARMGKNSYKLLMEEVKWAGDVQDKGKYGEFLVNLYHET